MAGLPIGIDVSKWQGAIDWTRVAAAGIQFAFIRASNGDSIDPRFVENWRGATAAGVIPGAYHYFECPGADVDVQVDTFLDQLYEVWVPGEPGLPPVLDAEEGRPNATIIHRWLLLVESATDLCPWIYTNANWWTNSSGIGPDERFERYPLWVSHWHAKTPRIPQPWTDYIAWQHTNVGRVDGISTNVDINVFNGKPEDLRWMARA